MILVHPKKLKRNISLCSKFYARQKGEKSKGQEQAQEQETTQKRKIKILISMIVIIVGLIVHDNYVGGGSGGGQNYPRSIVCGSRLQEPTGTWWQQPSYFESDVSIVVLAVMVVIVVLVAVLNCYREGGLRNPPPLKDVSQEHWRLQGFQIQTPLPIESFPATKALKCIKILLESK